MDKLDYAGIDVSAKTLEVAIEREGKVKMLTIPNNATGHSKLRKKLEMKKDRTVRVVFESTGVYGLDMAIMLSESETVEVCEANPRAVRRFAEASMKRGKSDRTDALVLLEYARRMEFRRYCKPSDEALSLRSVTRRMRTLTEMGVEEKNRLHAATSTNTTPCAIIESLKTSIDRIAESIDELEVLAMEIVEADVKLARKFEIITSVKGIARTSGLRILGELVCMPQDLDCRQLVAMTGLDPVVITSGTSVLKKRGISRQGNKHLRTALYMPAMVGKKFDRHIAGYFDHLVANGKKKAVANTAIMRKLLHSIHGMLKHDEMFDGSKFFRLPQPESANNR